MEELIQYSIQDEQIAILTLNRPEQANSLSAAMLEEINQTIQEIKHDENIRCLLMTGAGANVFCAGADLKERRFMTDEEAKQAVLTIQQTFTEIESLPVPVIAVINGHALGGGLELALACDLRIARAGAALGLPETGLAILPGAGGTQRLPRLIGIGKAKELIFTGTSLRAEEAIQIGLIEHISFADSLMNDAIALAKQMVKNGPIALKEAKQAIQSSLDHDLQTGLTKEHEAYLRLIHTEDRMEGLKAFQEKRTPHYRGK
ncbi:enoyl-CoA hydratase [Bacillus xiamenensis]|uniref:Enoyl-CoA hydratase n=1 Tax=Bacillus xiamenensis TaxID=1178537 RepID=A0ABT4F696_9BACI|nr:enoyl-CoA hydratase [Bacillus xiamenensis]EKF34456.1 enoyl-CoA hydratase [Bacillus xiamenensis]MBG9912831.1 enoyl-CoA hydratase [Bacillus xiamenensis]MCW1836172.1 enoyl-CoA hydratase [Bacillus xiamenensis]MCY9577576.1 enoyl-CoA hydratase [Bacillus xiamenensis]